MSEVSPVLVESSTHDGGRARRLLQCAQGALQKWPEGFAGFSAAIRCRDGHDRVEGEVRVFVGGRVEVHLAHDPLAGWAKRALGAISLARTPRFFKDGDGRFPITFEPEDGHPLGRGVRVQLGDTAWRTYWIDAKARIRHLENTAPTKRATATYDGFVRTCPGRILPTRTRIVEWDVMAQTLIETAEIEDAYERQHHVWLPARRHTTIGNATARRELVLELTGHVLL